MNRPAAPLPTAAPSLTGRDVLVLSPTPTWPLDAGNRKRVFRICSDLKARGARVHLLYYPLEWPFTCVPQQHLDAMTAQWDSFQLLPVSLPLQAAPAGHHHHIDEWWDPAIEPMLRWLLQRGHYDAFIVNYPYLSKALEFAHPRTLRILDMHDRFSGRRELLEGMGLKPEFFYTTEGEERKALQRADLVWAIKDEEATFFRTITDKEVITMPHCDPQQMMPPRNTQEGAELVLGMVGARNSLNYRNAMMFIEQVLPQLCRMLAPVKVRFGGGMCADLEQLQPQPAGIELAGRFDQPEDFYGTVDAILVPLTFSTGLKIKAVEAFALGLPVIAHRHAVEGIPVTHRFHLCDSARQIAQSCLELAADRALLAELRQATAATYAALKERTEAALAITAKRIVQRPMIVLTVAPEVIDVQGLYWAHFHETMDYLRHLGEIVLFIDRPLSGGFAAWCEGFNWLATEIKAVFSPAAARAMKLSDDRRNSPPFPLFYSVESFVALRRRSGQAPMWLIDLPAELVRCELPPAELGPACVRLDTLRLLPQSGEAALVQVLAHYPQLTAVGMHGAFNDPALAQTGRPAAQEVPFWRHMTAASGLHRPGPEGGVWVLCSAALMPWADALRHAIQALDPQAREPLLVLADGEARSAGEALPADSGRRLADFQDIWAGLGRRHAMPRAVVDASGEHAWLEALRETLQRAGVPVLRATRAASAGSAPPLNEDSKRHPVTLAGLIDGLSELVLATTGNTEHERNYHNDAGWQWVWRTISISKALGLTRGFG